MNLDNTIDFRNGFAYIGDEPIVSLESLPAMLNNENLKKLRKEYMQKEQEFLDVKARYLLNPEDDDGYLAAITRRKKAKHAMEQLESVILKLTLQSVEGGVKGNLTPRQRKAYALLEQGNSEMANNILDIDEIRMDYEHEVSLCKMVEERLEQCVVEMLQKIDVLMTMTQDRNRFEQIELIYDEVVKWEEKHNLKKIAMARYIQYLSDIENYSKAEGLARQYLKWMELSESVMDISYAEMSLAILLQEERKIQEAGQLFEDSMNKRYEISIKNESLYSFTDQIMILSGLSNYAWYLVENFKWEEFDKILAFAELEFSMIMLFEEDSDSANSFKAQIVLISFLEVRGRAYHILNQISKAEDTFKEALKLEKELIDIYYANQILEKYANTLYNLGVVYADGQCYEKAENSYREAIKI